MWGSALLYYNRQTKNSQQLKLKNNIMTIKTKQQNRHKIIQAGATTSADSYEYLDNTIKQTQTIHNLIINDFNCKLGYKPRRNENR